jgi:transcriptional regulator with XRE-family HTH domain
MEHSLDDVIVSLPRDERARIEARDAELTQDLEGLRALRQIAGKAQADVAAALKIKQPSVSKIEKQAEMHVSTLRSYVEAVGGKLELTVRLPKRPAVRIHALGDGATDIFEKPGRRKTSFTKTRGRR